MKKCKLIQNILCLFKGADQRPAGLQSAPVTEEFERCVICGKLTDVPVSTPVDFREEEYEIGCGQLCNSCRLKLREEAQTGWVLSDRQVLKAVEQSRTDNNDG